MKQALALSMRRLFIHLSRCGLTKQKDTFSLLYILLPLGAFFFFLFPTKGFFIHDVVTSPLKMTRRLRRSAEFQSLKPTYTNVVCL